jgi:hypothetical protein
MDEESKEFIEKVHDAVNRVYNKMKKDKRDTIIDNDDIINIKILIGLHGDNSEDFINNC